MHIIEAFALNSGSKIDQPYIYDSYIPLPKNTEKYITFQPQGNPKYTSRIYSYWEEVMDILRPVLNKHEIRVVQLGGKGERAIKGTIPMAGRTSVNQAAYLIKNGLLHLGVDSFAIHLASGYQKKIVGLYAPMLPEQSGPYWSEKKDVRLMSGIKEGDLPSYFPHEDPKTIDAIAPEDVARNVCDLLGLEFDYEFETVFTGEEYCYKRVELVPSHHIGNWKDFQVDSLIARMDKEFNEQVLASQLDKCPCSVVTDKPINLQLIRGFKDKITEMVFKVQNADHIEYIKQLKTTGVKLYLISDLPQEDYDKLKIKFLDITGVVHRPKRTKEDFLKEHDNLDINDLYFKTSTCIIRDQGVYATYCEEEDKPLRFFNMQSPQKIYDSPTLWEDLNRLLILKKK